MNDKLCPWMGRECQSVNCALWIRYADRCGGGCAIAVIAEKMGAVSGNVGCIADNLGEIVAVTEPTFPVDLGKRLEDT